MLRYLGFILTGLIILFAATPDVEAQWIQEKLPFFQENPDFHLPLKCSADEILRDPVSKKALENFLSFRKANPNAPLASSDIEDSEEGDTRTFRVRNLETNNWMNINFILVKRNEYLLIWVEEDEFAPNRVNQAVVDALFDAMVNETPSLSVNPQAGIMEINESVFGNPPNVNGSGALNILITDVQDGWEPGRGTVGGFFDPVDLDPANANSNRADIIYLNSFPTIHRDGVVNVLRPRSIAAHEYQHLIHANYGNLVIFQNEGQSEWAELLTGFPGRTPRYLDSPLEMNRFLYLWRSNSESVLLDYQRASLLHSYINERIGPDFTGSITRSPSSLNNAYAFALNPAGVDLSEVLMDFHIANVVNDTSIEDGRFGYEDIRRRASRITHPTFTYFSGQTSGNRSSELLFGSVDYTEFIGVQDMSISVSGDPEVDFAFVLYDSDLSIAPQVFKTGPGTHQFNGSFERIILVSAAIEESNINLSPNTTYAFSYDAEWNTLPVIIQRTTHAGQAAFFAELPGTPGNPNREGIQMYAKRFSPEFDGRVKQVQFTINGRDSSLVGSDNLRITLRRAQQAGANFLPGARVDSLFVPVTSLTRGENTIPINSGTWTLVGGEEYFIEFFVTSASSRIEFLLDEGSENASDPSYYPVRSIALIGPPTRPTPQWASYSNNNNLLVTLVTSSEYSGPLLAPTITSQPTGGGFIPGNELTLSVSATGTPAPSYQWYKDGLPLYGENNAQLVFTEMAEDDAGSYQVLVSNPAGFEFSNIVLLETRFERFILEQNYPNPFNPFFQPTTVEFVLPEDSDITIDVFDIQGRLMQRVIENQPFTQGRKTVALPQSLTKQWAAGVYLYRVTANDGDSTRRRTRKMLIIK